jgi:exopolysaccharide production protein ExoZ
MAWHRVLYLGIPATLVVWGAMQIEAKRSVFTYLGDASYALYLVHLPVVLTVVWALCRFTVLPPDAIALAAAAASILLAWRIHELFEKPMLGWFRKPAPLPTAA